MSFDKKGFSPVHINAGSLSPRIFSYFSKDDFLSEILKPGYFNAQKMIMRPNSFVKVVCSDAVVELLVEANTPDVTMRNEFFRASDPYVEAKSRVVKRRKVVQKKKAEEKLAKTG